MEALISGIRQNWAVWLPFGVAAAPVAVGAIRLLGLARGDFEIFVALLSVVSLATIWISAAMSIAVGSILLAPLAVLTSHWPSTETGSLAPMSPRRTAVRLLLVGISVAPLAYLAFDDSILKALYVAGLWMVLGLVLLRAKVATAGLGAAIDALPPILDDADSSALRRRSESPERAQRRFMKGTLAVICIAIATILMGPPGLPRERVQIRGESELSEGYVLAVDDLSLSLLYANGGIRHIPGAEAVGRFTCGARDDVRELKGTRRLVELLVSSKPPYRPTECSMPVRSG